MAPSVFYPGADIQAHLTKALLKTDAPAIKGVDMNQNYDVKLFQFSFITIKKITQSALGESKLVILIICTR